MFVGGMRTVQWAPFNEVQFVSISVKVFACVFAVGSRQRHEV